MNIASLFRASQQDSSNQTPSSSAPDVSDAKIQAPDRDTMCFVFPDGRVARVSPQADDIEC